MLINQLTIVHKFDLVFGLVAIIKDLRQYSLNAVSLRQFVIISDRLNVDSTCT